MTIGVGCASINSNGQCIQCFNGYVLSAGACFPDFNCNGPATCTACALNNYLNNGQCTPCSSITNCQTCDPSSPTSCMICNAGYYVNVGTCRSCMSNCQKCSSLNYCT